MTLSGRRLVHWQPDPAPAPTASDVALKVVLAFAILSMVSVAFFLVATIVAYFAFAVTDDWPWLVTAAAVTLGAVQNASLAFLAWKTWLRWRIQ